MSALPKQRLTVADYFAIERDSQIKHEYLDGEIYMMSGASRDHERIVSDVDTSLNNQLRERGCEVFGSNMRVEADASAFFYADLLVVCGEAQFGAQGGLDTLRNPNVIIEVLSPSTETFDRGVKFQRYQRLESLQTYVLIAQNKPIVEVYTRQTNGKWLYALAQGMDATVTLDSIGCMLPLSEVYRRVTFEPDDPAA